MENNFYSLKRLFVFLMLLALPAQGMAQQGAGVTIRNRNITIQRALNQVERQTKMPVNYNQTLLDVNRAVSLNISDSSVGEAMDAILHNTGFTYRVEGEHIIIVPVPQQQVETPQATRRQRTVKVTDIQENPVIGATVMIKGTTTGASTSTDGIANITAADNDILVVGFLGYQSTELSPFSSTNINVTLSEDNQRLDDIVIVGYNQVRRAQTTGSLATVASEKLEFSTSASLEDKLQGQAAGLMIATSSGQPGTEYIQIRLRGTGSINATNNPLYIMDGVAVEPRTFAALNSNDIEDIKVLKDAAATAVYGSRGANGVIVITTKTGQSGKTVINYRNQFGFSWMPDYIDMMNSAENIQYQLQAAISDPSYTAMYPLMPSLLREYQGTATDADRERLAKARATDTDWIDQMTQTGFMQEHSLTVSGGDDKTKFFISGAYQNQEGTLKKSAFESFSGRFNIDHQALNWLNVGVKMTTGYSITDYSDPSGSGNRTSYLNPFFTALLAYPYESPDDWYNVDNPTLLNKYRDSSAKRLKMVGATYARARITDWLSFTTNFGMDFQYTRTNTTLHRDHPNASNNGGSYSYNGQELGRYTWTNTLNFNYTLDNGHVINAVGGMEMFQGKYNYHSYNGYDLNADMMESPAGIGDKNGTSENPPTIGGSRTMSNLLSYFAQASYSIGNKYNVSGSLRYDESSKFQGDNKWAVFWSVGASWNMNQENWLSDVAWLNLLKLRASYGTTGNQTDVSDFGAYDGYGNSSYNGQSGYAHSQLGNANLKWESSEQFNVGFDFSVLNQRLNGTIDLYHNTTKDLIMPKNISMTSGFENIQTNAGSIINKGIEVTLNGTPVSTRDITWTIGANFTYNRNEWKDLGEYSNAENRYVDGYYVIEKGRPVHTWIISKWAGVNSQNGLVEFYKEDGSRSTDITEAYQFSDYGSAQVPVFGGFNTTFRYKSFRLDAQFTYALNYTLMNTMRWYIYNHFFNGNKPREMLNMWMNPGDETNIPAFIRGTQPSPMASQFLEDADYLRFKNLRLNYALPTNVVKKLKYFDGITVYAQAENIKTWTNYTGADPEVDGGYDYMSYPKPRVISFGIDINF